ncbi:SDR family NAD(P)-dependent oxidoreductase [Dactylosporangium sp. CA-152071]|uniref:SDR family NAD(P)-dependent oxidoreductase n=1 Tax=Dactylosporangium sp. CA-152071 TaxID=3239933 RepID=UPI003D8BF895
MQSDEQVLDYLKRVTADLRRTRQRVRELEADTAEPIAIVGMAGRFPGGVNTPEQLWQLLVDGRDAMTSFPDDRGWNLGGGESGYATAGGFIDGVADFDAGFFGISPREALAMDPQQRLLLEASWEALERAGIDPSSLQGSQTGVFVGTSGQDYLALLARAPQSSGGYLATGVGASVLSGRVSYVLGLEGPAVTVDTACSSSLVALHLAVQALRRGECDLALAGGVTVMSTPTAFAEFSRQGGLAPDGRCKAYAAGADGTGWSEGVGVLVLQRLSAARRPLAVVRGSAVNQDGASNGLTAPSGPAQERVLRLALGSAGLGPGDVDVVEGHGTGTRLGDPIEVGALLEVFGGRAGAPVLLGSVKSNIGHTQAAAGVVGVMKMVLALRAGVVPASLHVDEPSPVVDWSAGGVEVVRELVDWPEVARPRRAGVSSFGISGTNAHVILEQVPEPEAEPDAEPDRPVVWALSGRTEAALRAQAAQLAGAVGAAAGTPASIGATLALGRAALAHRAAVVGHDPDALAAALSALAAGRSLPGVATGTSTEPDPRAVFVFPGQGSQWVGMAVELLESSVVFAEWMGLCGVGLGGLVDWDLLEVVRGGVGLDRVDVVQPVSFAVMVSLAAVWRSFGVEPVAVVGHSQGEIAAAVVAGVLSLVDGCRVVVLRSRALVGLAGSGGMVSVGLPVGEVEGLVAGFDGRLSVAAVNGPGSTVVSGDPEALEELLAAAAARDARARAVPVDYASHSPAVERIRDEVHTALAPVAPRAAETAMYSTVDGRWIDGPEMTAGYWYRNLRQPVQFHQAIGALMAEGHRTFIEVSAHPVLTAAIQETADQLGLEAHAVGTLRRDEGDLHRLYRSLAEAWTAGVPADWSALFAGTPRADLPTYAFQRQRYWIEASQLEAGDLGTAGLRPAEHPLLGAAIHTAHEDGLLLTGRLSVQTHPWLADHAVRGTVLLPGAVLTELAVHAGDQLACGEVEELTMAVPLVLPDQGGVQLQVMVEEADESGRRHVVISSRPESTADDRAWTRHAEGILSTAPAPAPAGLEQWPPADAEPVDVTRCYDELLAAGYEYGPAFQGLRAAWRRDGEVFAEVALPEDHGADADRFTVHPALLDAALQAAALLPAGRSGEGPDGLAFAWTGLRCFAAGATLLRVRLARSGPGAVTVLLAAADGQPVATIDRLVFRPASETAARPSRLFRTVWEPLAASAAQPPATAWTATGADLEPLVGPDGAVPDVVLARVDGDQDARSATGAVLRLVQRWLADERFTGSRLALVTSGAVAVMDEERVAAPAHAAVWGLIRSAQSEHPGRLVLLDLDTAAATGPEPAILALPLLDEPQLAVRDGRGLVPRLAAAAPSTVDTPPFGPQSTVLVVGAFGGLGPAVVRHLVTQYGVRDLVLTSRRAPGTDDLPALVEELAAIGATAVHVTCDVSDRDAVRQLLQTHACTAVVHLAGVVDDAVVSALTEEQLAAAFGPKVDGATHLHELTRHLPLSAFVLFSSAAATFGGPGQGSYAAANAYLDALAQQRRHDGLPAVSLGWGAWSEQRGMFGRLAATDVDRMARNGVTPLPTQEALELLDSALRATDAVVLPIRLDTAALRRQAESGPVPALLRRLVPGRIRKAARATTGDLPLRTRLAGLSAQDRAKALLDLVRGEVAAVLGHPSVEAIDPARAAKDLGFDSLTAVDLRNRLAAATGLRLPTTIVFDYPTVIALAERVAAELLGEGGTDVPAVTTAATGEPVAVVGMACRLPGGVNTPEEFWQLLVSGADAIAKAPTDRGWDLPEDCPAVGGFIDGAADFDAGFFGISPREALAMDPQQRLLLEASWEALERAGIDPLSLRGSQTGVFVGTSGQDYAALLANAGEDSDAYLVTGVGASVMSGRIAYEFGLEGPAVTVDTACSSSLVALHLAAQALRRGECDLALVCGATVMSTPGVIVGFTEQQGLSADGRCKAFAEGADGTGLSEGVGVLVLQRLSVARRPLAVVRGSAVNQDGASNGLTAPSGRAQERVLRSALGSAGLGPGDVDVVEGHGTGTRLGDPIEVGALLGVFGNRVGAPLLLGSVKSNVGHTQAAAGVAGVMKMVLALQTGVVPASLHARELSPVVDWSVGGVEVVRELADWPVVDRVRRAGVSSFGISGTNAHVILEQAPEVPLLEREAVGGPVAWVLSARSGEALRDQAVRLREFVAGGGVRVGDVAVSLAGRSVFGERAVVVGSDVEELVAGLDAVVPGPAVRSPGGVGLVFSGQGAQWVGMGAGLYARFPAFASVLDEVCGLLDGWLGGAGFGVSVRDVVLDVDGAGRLVDETVFAQAGLFAVEVALVRLLESWGVVGDVLVGHSLGELVAACVAGVWSLADGCRVVAARGRLMQGLGEGLMVAVAAGVDVVVPLLVDGVEVAAVNSSSSVVVSGSVGAVGVVEERLVAAGCRVRRLRGGRGLHSGLVEPMLAEFAAVLAEVTFRVPRVALVSTVSGRVDEEGWADPGYWVRQVREPVRFADAVAALVGLGVSTVVEVGPDGVLTPLIAEQLGGPEVVAVAAQRRQEPADRALLSALAQLYVRGHDVAWGRVLAGAGRGVDLPTYAFQRQRYWLDNVSARNLESVGLATVGHPLLGAAVESPDGGTTFTTRLSVRTHPWLADHQVHGAVILPGTAFVEAAIRAGDEFGCPLLEELVIDEPLVLGGGVDVRVHVGAAAADGRRSVTVHSRPAGQEPGTAWTRHATGSLGLERAAAPDVPVHEPWPPADVQPVDLDGFYERCAAAGFEYGPAFQGLTAAWRQGSVVYADVTLPDRAAADASRFGLHPALLDAAMHALGHGVFDDDTTSGWLPFSWNGVRLRAVNATRARVRIERAGPAAVRLTLADQDGIAVAEVEAVALRPAPARQLAGARADSLYAVDWQPAVAEGTPAAGILIGPDLFGLRPAGVVADEAYDDFAAVPPTATPIWVCLAPADPATDRATAARAATHHALGLVRRYLVQEHLADSRLVVVTRQAVAVAGEAPDVAAAAAWGLLRAARSEHPGRFLLVDVDATGDNDVAATVRPEEPEIALRNGAVLVPRLVRVPPAESEPDTRLGPDDVVLVTGGTGGLGALIARHLVAGHGVRRLVLVSRHGPSSPAVGELRASLEASGAEVTIEACDVTDRAALGRLLAGHPVTAVVHAAGVVDDGMLGSLTGSQIDAVLAPKIDGAWHLHELTRHIRLSAFVTYSSSAALFGAAGQSNYAAANAFMDALAARRRAEGLPAHSLAWGLWAEPDGMGGRLGAADVERITRRGLAAMPAELGFALFDEAIRHDRAVLAPMRLDLAALRRSSRTTPLPSLLSVLVPAAPARSRAGAGTGGRTLAERLAGQPDRAREQLVLSLVRRHVAAVLGHPADSAIEAERPFDELGFTSLTAVELRNALAEATGVRLPATVVFDHPTPRSLARHLLEGLVGVEEPAAPTVRTGPVDDDPIAIVGMGCRLPGGVSSPEAFWRLVAGGVDAISEFPRDRGWDLDALFDEDPDAPGKSYVRHGGFIDGVAGFDAGFFGISPREALAMDPQQRLLLEASWEALERAGIDPLSLRGSQTGVYVGLMYQDYAGLAASIDDAEGFLATGNAGSVLSGRVAYTLGLEGPAVTVDTACSSSLVALHLAAQALRRGECDLAIVGGATVMSTPKTFTGFSRQRGLAPDGRCKSFGAGADGTGWSEGVGVLVLQRLSVARRPLAVVRGSAVNQDGASNGLTAPSGRAQERVLRSALGSAGLGVSDVDVVEGHGTGTRLGDPIEVGALLEVFGGRTGAPLLLGSAKSNVGHTQAAAGAVGVMKMVLALEAGVVPASLHARELSPVVDWSAGGVEVVRELVDWPEVGRPRRAGVSSFGVSGTNAHVILEQAPEPVVDVEPEAGPGPVAWVLSARSKEALRDQIARLREFVSGGGVRVGDVAVSLAGRSVFGERAVVVGSEVEELVAGLDAVVPGPAVRSPGGVGLVFSGQGAQWVGMGAGLYARFPAFASVLDEVCGLLDGWLGGAGFGVSVRDVVLDVDGAGRLVDETVFAQAGLFAVEVALVRLLESWGVVGDVLVGHSLGELVAACVAGVWSLADGCRVVAARGRLMQGLGEGLMVAVAAGVDVVVPLLVDGVEVAAVNSSSSVVVSGPVGAVAVVEERLVAAGCRVRRLRGGRGLHSGLVEPMLAQYAAELAEVTFQAPKVALVSTVTGRVEDERWTDPGYWVRQVREPVRFADAVAALVGLGVSTVVEVGPDGVLTPLIAEQLGGPEVVAVAAQSRREPQEQALLTAMAQVHTRGHDVAWDRVLAGAGRRIGLPTYAFQHHRYWIDPAPDGGRSSLGHPILHSVVRLAGSAETVLTGRLPVPDGSWLGDHRVSGSVLAPGTALLELALRAGREVGCDVVEELVIETPLALAPSTATSVQIRIDERGRRMRLYSCTGDPGGGDPWTLHATGRLGSAAGAPPEPVEWPPPGAVEQDIEGHYEQAVAAGFDYGPYFRGLAAVRLDDDAAYVEAALPDEVSHEAGFELHPALLDAVLHGAGHLRGLDESATGWMPFSWTGVRQWNAAGSAVQACLRATGPHTVAVTVVDASGAPVLSVDALGLRPATGARPRARFHDARHEVVWTPRETSSQSPAVRWTTIRSAGELERVAGATLPDAVVLDCRDRGEPAPAAAHQLAAGVLSVLQSWLARPQDRSGRLVVVTSRAVDVGPGHTALDLVAAPVWGLVRSAQSEQPGRFVLLDLESAGTPLSDEVLAGALAMGEPQVAYRDGTFSTPRLARSAVAAELEPPGDGSWRLEVTERGTFDAVALAPLPPDEPGPNEVRVEVRAAGLNFRDVLNVLGQYPGDPGRLGLEGAGVVSAVGSDVDSLRPGDRVMGLMPGAFARHVLTDHRLLVPIPPGWSFAAAASVPLVFLTAWYGLRELGALEPASSVLVHAGASGVGMAAVQIAAALGAEVYATASPGKWETLRALGLDDDHIASSRDTGFEEQFRRISGGHGVDVVLNALTGPFVDASARLLARGGRFVEMGKADIREPEFLAALAPGASYRAFDLAEAAPEQLGRMLAEVVEQIERGSLRTLPLRTWDVRQAVDALRFMGQGRHVGKIVLTVPAPPDRDGTVLVTGGTGALGAIAARHLAGEGVRHLILASRRGPDAPEAAALRDELTALGVDVRLAACDVSDRAAVAGLLAGIPAEHPLTAVIHTAGVVDDGLVGSLDDARLRAVLGPKLGAAWHLHELTSGLDLSAFVLYSSVAGVLGAPAQANYAAANAFLDALAAHRRAQGLPAVSLAWGLWDEASGMTGTLGQDDRHRIARAGVRPLSTVDALGLLDDARHHARALAVPVRLDPRAFGDDPPAMLRDLVQAEPRRLAASAPQNGATLRRRLAAQDEHARHRTVLELARTQVATVLGRRDAGSIERDRGFTELGFDSLLAVELRNRLNQATGLQLATTVVFDHPTLDALTAHLLAELVPAGPGAQPAVLADLDALAANLSNAVLDDRGRAEVGRRLRTIWSAWSGTDGTTTPDSPADLDTATDDDLFRLVDGAAGPLHP